MEEKRVAEFKDRLKEGLELRSMRPADLMYKTGVPKSALSYYLSGRSKPKADRLYLIAQALGVSEVWLMGYDVPIDGSKVEKKNDVISDIIVRMRHDKDFLSVVTLMYNLDSEQLGGVRQMLSAFAK